MLKIRNELLEFVERSQLHKTVGTLVGEFADIADRQGFNAFIMTGLPSVGDEVEPLIIANRWPETWTERYVEEHYFRDDPVSRWSLSQSRPFLWREAWQAHLATERVKKINGEAATIGLRDGIALPMPSFSAFRAVISLASDQRLDLQPGAEGLLYTAAIFFQTRAVELSRGANMPRLPLLTDREREILKWFAMGKTSWDVSVILSIAENTVKNHMKSIRQKLNVANATQAVVQAITSGQIQL